MITFLYLLVCLLSGDISVRIDILQLTALIDVTIILGEVAVELYKVKKKWEN